jgi:hypothetical protein
MKEAPLYRQLLTIYVWWKTFVKGKLYFVCYILCLMEFCACSVVNTMNTAEQPLAKMGLQSNESWVSLIKHRLNFKAKSGLFCKTT